jgi:hypothetical protein
MNAKETTYREFALESIHGIERDLQIMIAELAPTDYAVLDGTAFVIAKIEDDGSTTGYVHVLNKDGHAAGIEFTTPTRANRWSRKDAQEIVNANAIVPETGTLVVLHYWDAYTRQIEKDVAILDLLEAALDTED